jgi:hypothetical protein
MGAKATAPAERRFGDASGRPLQPHGERPIGGANCFQHFYRGDVIKRSMRIAIVLSSKVDAMAPPMVGRPPTRELELLGRECDSGEVGARPCNDLLG